MTAIDMRLEPMVREALAAVIAEDPQRLDREFQKISKLPEDDLLHALRIASGVLHVVLYRMENRKPTPTEIDKVATEMVESEAWASLRHEDVATILTAHADLRDISSLQPAEKVASLLFVVTGALISGCAPAEHHWANFLDECENMLDGM